MMSCVRIALALMFLAASIGAQTACSQDVLPDKPTPHANFVVRPFHDKQILVLAGIDAGLAAWDDVATRRELDAGGYERNPLIRPFVHNSGTLAAETVGEVWLAAFVADRMKRSHHAYLRKTWWLPQILEASARLYGGINNTLLLR
jgi:hypothetical protein